MKKEDLETLFISEQFFLEHWMIQMELDEDITKVYERMKKRYDWLESELEKLKI